MKDYYEILGVSRNASLEVIKAAYHALAKKYHPDSGQYDSGYSGKMMGEVNEAYSVLSDEESRREYDKKIKGTARERAGEEAKAGNNHAAVYQQQHEREDEKGTGTEDKAGCGGCLVVLILIGIIIFAIVKYHSSIYSFFSNLINFGQASEKNQYKENTPEYTAWEFLNQLRDIDVKVDSAYLGNEFGQGVEALEEIYDEDNLFDEYGMEYFNDDYVEEIHDFKYEIIESKEMKNGHIKATVNIMYTNYESLMEDCIKKIEKESKRIFGISGTLEHVDYKALTNKYLDECRPDYKWKSEIKIDLMLKEKNGRWIIYSWEEGTEILSALFGVVDWEDYRQ